MNIRKSNIDDINEIHSLQVLCFSGNDRWSKYIYTEYINNSLVLECDGRIVSVLIQGYIYPSRYNKIFYPINDLGQKFLDDNKNKSPIFGIVLIFTDDKFRKKGLAEMLINKHFELNKNQTLCLNTRTTNSDSISLYKKVGYEHIANIERYYQSLSLIHI